MNAKIIKAAIIYFQQNLFYAHQFVSETVDNEILELFFMLYIMYYINSI